MRDALIAYEARIELLGVAVDPLQALDGMFDQHRLSGPPHQPDRQPRLSLLLQGRRRRDDRARRPQAEQALDAEMVRRATAVLSGDGSAVPPGRIASRSSASRRGSARRSPGGSTAFRKNRRTISTPRWASAAIRRCRPVCRSCSSSPTRRRRGAGAGRDPPDRRDRRSARRLRSRTRHHPRPWSIVAMSAVDLETDRIFLPPPGVVDARLPRVAPILRFLASGAGAGATKLQIDPAEGLGPGRFLKFGSAPDGPERTIVTVEDDLVTIEPPLAATLPKGTPVREVTDFAPFAPGGQDRQSHRSISAIRRCSRCRRRSALSLPASKMPRRPSGAGGARRARKARPIGKPSKRNGRRSASPQEGERQAREKRRRRPRWVVASCPLPGGSSRRRGPGHPPGGFR